MENVSLKQWIENYNNHDYDNSDFDTQCRAGWYDWFCSDKSLANRLKKLAPKVIRISKSAKVNPETMYVFFKNNCPMNGDLYDDFRICDMKTGDVIFTVVPRSGHKIDEGLGEVWGKENGWDGAIMRGNMKEIYEYFGV